MHMSCLITRDRTTCAPALCHVEYVSLDHVFRLCPFGRRDARTHAFSQCEDALANCVSAESKQACSVTAPTALSGLCDAREGMDASYLSGVISLSVDQLSSLQVHADTDRQCRVISGTNS